MKIEYVTDIDLLRDVGEHWLAEHRADEYGFDVDPDAIIAESKEWLATGTGAVIGLVCSQYVGFMSLYCVPEFLGLKKPIAFEKYWYIIREYRSGALLMLNEAKRWAKEQGACHLIMSASAMASGMYENLCALYERMEMQPFEKSYICEL